MPLFCRDCDVGLPHGSVWTTVTCRYSGQEKTLNSICDANPQGLRYWASRHRRIAEAMERAAQMLEQEGGVADATGDLPARPER